MDDIHRELLLKRQRYLRDNVIMEEGLLSKLRESGVFNTSMIQVIQSEIDNDRQMARLLDMLTKRGPEAYDKFMDCLSEDYPWVVQNFREKEAELMEQDRAESDVNRDIRQTVKAYVKELARTTRMNNAQRKNVEDFLCRQITIDTNLNSGSMPGRKLYAIHRRLMQGIPLSSLDESDQGDLENILPDNVTIDKIEKEVSLLVDRVQELETIIESCYEKLGETSKDKFLPDLVFCQHKLLLERDIKIEELKQKVQSQQKTMRLAREKERRAREESEKNKEGKDEVVKSLDTLKIKIQKMQEERQRMGMRMAFDVAFGSTIHPNVPSGVASQDRPRKHRRSSVDKQTEGDDMQKDGEDNTS
ncbi:DNA ligase 1-like [Dreissena polymorpha]|uniref:DNA ligase 1-like n=1 Tax=Dreissena polymorpha TaxID=45954 RepID=UPI002263E1C1|nr:DNA ligase 1-like [Dreissena polymorpha]